MAKWSRIETVLTPFLMAKQAREKGDMEASEGYAKRATDMMSSLVEMAKLKQQIDMAPSEIEYKKTLQHQAYGAGELSLSVAEQNRAETAQKRNYYMNFADVAKKLNLDSTDPEVMKNLADVMKSAVAVKEYGERTAPGVDYYGAQAGADVAKFGAEKAGSEYTKTLYGERETQGVAPVEVGAEKVGFEVKRDYGLQAGKAEMESKVGQALTEMAEGKRAEDIINAEIEANKRKGLGSVETPSEIYFSTLTKTTALENVIARYYQMQTALDSKDITTSNDALSSAMVALGMGGPVTTENKEQLMSKARVGLAAKIKELESTKRIAWDMNAKLGGIEFPKPPPPPPTTNIQAPGSKVMRTQSEWDKMTYEQQKRLSDRLKVYNEFGELLLPKPEPKAEVKPTQQEKPVKPTEMGNKIVEKKSAILTDKQKKLLEKFAQ